MAKSIANSNKNQPDDLLYFCAGLSQHLNDLSNRLQPYTSWHDSDAQKDRPIQWMLKLPAELQQYARELEEIEVGSEVEESKHDLLKHIKELSAWARKYDDRLKRPDSYGKREELIAAYHDRFEAFLPHDASRYSAQHLTTRKQTQNSASVNTPSTDDQREFCRKYIALERRINQERVLLVKEARRRFDALSNIADRLAASPDPSPDSPSELTAEAKEDQPPALTESLQVTLCALNEFSQHILASVAKICEKIPPSQRLSEETVRECVLRLVELELAERPEGSRKGARLTLEGRRTAGKITD